MKNFKKISDHAQYLAGEFHKKHPSNLGLCIVSNENGYLNNGEQYSYIGVSAGHGCPWMVEPSYNEVANFFVCCSLTTGKYFSSYKINNKLLNKPIEKAVISEMDFETLMRDFIRKTTGQTF